MQDKVSLSTVHGIIKLILFFGSNKVVHDRLDFTFTLFWINFPNGICCYLNSVIIFNHSNPATLVVIVAKTCSTGLIDCKPP